MVSCPKCSAENDSANVSCHRCGSSLIQGTTDREDPYVGRTIGRDIRLERHLGSGEIGMVYEAINASNDKRIAVKVIHADVAENHGDELLRWAKRSAQIRHAKVASVLAANREADGLTYIATEYLDGQTLMAQLRQSGPFDPIRAADVLFQTCSALAPIHRVGRPHANLKPENVFILDTDSTPDFVKIVDVGSPTLFGLRIDGDRRIIVGTPKYFSPEQARGESVGLTSDQFSLGIIGYLLLTGALPFFGPTPDALLNSILGSEPKSVNDKAPRVPEALAAIIHRCLSKDPYERFQDLRALATALAKFINQARQGVNSDTEARGSGDADTTHSSPAPTVSPSMEDDDESVDDRTMLLSVPSELKGFLEGEEAEAPPREEITEELMDIPQPLSFTGELNTADINSAIADALHSVHVTDEPVMTEIDDEDEDEEQAAEPSADSDLADALRDASDDVGEGPSPDHDLLVDVGTGAQPLADVDASEDELSDDSLDDLDELGYSTVDLSQAGAPPGGEVSGLASGEPAREPSQHSQTGSLLPEDIISALGQELVGSAPSGEEKPVSDASGPLATPEDFANHDADNEMGIARQRLQRTLQRVRSSRPWMIALLMSLLIVSALYARLQNVEEELQAERRDIEVKTARLAKLRAEKITRRVKYPIHVLLSSEPTGATVIQAGVERGQTPLPMEFKRGGMQQFIIKMDGYRDLDYRIDPAGLKRDQDPVPLQLRLSKLDAKKPKAVQAPLVVSHGTEVSDESKAKKQAAEDGARAIQGVKPGAPAAQAPNGKVGSLKKKPPVVRPTPSRVRPNRSNTPRRRTKRKPKSDELVNPFE